MIRSDETHIPVLGVTHPGMSGKNNEDDYLITSHRVSETDSTPSLLAVLSDGVGGHQAGEVASKMAVEIISDEIARSTAEEPSRQLIDAISKASLRINQVANDRDAQMGMGATIACTWILGDRLYTASLGDSRIYLLRGRRIRQLTIDHTWIQEALQLGIIQPDEAEGHPNSHVIQRYMGAPHPPDVDIRLKMEDHETDKVATLNQGLHLKAGDIIFLCTDGLTDLVSDAEIHQVLTKHDMENALFQLTDMANQRGGHDNITMIAMQVPQSAVSKKHPFDRRMIKIGCLAAAGLIGMAVLIIFGLLFSQYFKGQTRRTLTPADLPTKGGFSFYTQNSMQTYESLPTQKPTSQMTISPQPQKSAQTSFDPTATITIVGDSAYTLTPWPTHTRQPTITLTP